MTGNLSPERESSFPNLHTGCYRVTSIETENYNCIAHAAGRNDKWWWPDDATGVHWPDGIELKETLDCFVHAYETEGFAVCQDGSFQRGYEKIAIYVDTSGTPTHAARQLGNGMWTSKLGAWEDIEHDTLEAIEGPLYGVVAQFMMRERKVQSKNRLLIIRFLLWCLALLRRLRPARSTR